MERPLHTPGDAVTAADRLAAAAYATIQMAGDPEGVDMTPLADAYRAYMDEREQKAAQIRREGERYMEQERKARAAPRSGDE